MGPQVGRQRLDRPSRASEWGGRSSPSGVAGGGWTGRGCHKLAVNHELPAKEVNPVHREAGGSTVARPHSAPGSSARGPRRSPTPEPLNLFCREGATVWTSTRGRLTQGVGLGGSCRRGPSGHRSYCRRWPFAPPRALWRAFDSVRPFGAPSMGGGRALSTGREWCGRQSPGCSWSRHPRRRRSSATRRAQPSSNAPTGLSCDSQNSCVNPEATRDRLCGLASGGLFGGAFSSEQYRRGNGHLLDTL